MSALSAAASDEDGDIIKNLQARVADLEAQLYAVGAGGVGNMEQPQVEQEPVAFREWWCMRPSLTRLQAWLIWKDEHKQPPRQPLTDAQINDHRLALPYDGEDLPDPWDFKQGVRAAERAHRIGVEGRK